MEEGSLVTPIALAYSGSANYVPNHLQLQHIPNGLQLYMVGVFKTTYSGDPL